MKHLWCVLTIVAACAGCGTASPPAWVYTKPGVADAELQQDRQTCLMQSVGSADVKALPTFAETLNREAFNECMRQRGYEVWYGSMTASRP
jgi:hypothetical protein